MGGLLVAALLPMAAAASLRFVVGPRSRNAGLLATGVTVVCLGLILAAATQYLDSPRVHSYSWVPQLGLNFTLMADGLSLLFALLITGIGTIVFGFATAYLRPDENRRTRRKTYRNRPVFRGYQRCPKSIGRLRRGRQLQRRPPDPGGEPLLGENRAPVKDLDLRCR